MRYIYIFCRKMKMDVLKSSLYRSSMGYLMRTLSLMKNGSYIYIYKDISTDKYKIPDLKKENLLCKPFITNHIIWMWGYFETIKKEPINDINTYNPICLKYANDNYYNERWEQLDKEYPWCWRAWSTNIFWFEYEVLTGLGLKRE